jgi:hypothetical protein
MKRERRKSAGADKKGEFAFGRRVASGKERFKKRGFLAAVRIKLGIDLF